MRAKIPAYYPADRQPRGRWVWAGLAAACLLFVLWQQAHFQQRIHIHRSLRGTGALAATGSFASSDDSSGSSSASSSDDSSSQALAPTHAGCAAQVWDVSSWAGSVGSAGGQPPFAFPKIIHQTVEDKHNVSCESLACMATWRDMNPGYEHRLYDSQDRLDFVAEHYPEILPVYNALSTNVERADLWRYLALHRFGGVYADSDVRCLRPVSEWNAGSGHDADMLAGVVFTDKGGAVTRVNNFILAAMPCHPVMAAMPFTIMSRIAAAGLRGGSVRSEKGKALQSGVVGRTGPIALTATIEDYARRVGAAWPVNATQGVVGNAGSLVGRVRVMPRNVMTMGWEVAAEHISCSDAAKKHPGAYICHEYYGTWKADYSHRPQLTFDDACTYFGSLEPHPWQHAAA